jgi:hypothetical protein
MEKLRWISKRSRSERLSWGDFVDFILFLIAIYIIISGFSLIAVATGEDIPYLPFWHAPWKLLFKLFGFLM